MGAMAKKLFSPAVAVLFFSYRPIEEVRREQYEQQHIAEVEPISPHAVILDSIIFRRRKCS
tara:strand:- start:469 stop:651 length:183 start_codon:yes stop_codon:yes gene_type:complete